MRVLPGFRTGRPPGVDDAHDGGAAGHDRSPYRNAQGTGSFAGFRIGEVLAGIGSTTAVGRTTAVQGTIAVSGSTLTAARVSADLTEITTNDSRRDDAVQRALSTSAGSMPASGERVTVNATGDLSDQGRDPDGDRRAPGPVQGDVLVVVGQEVA